MDQKQKRITDRKSDRTRKKNKRKDKGGIKLTALRFQTGWSRQSGSEWAEPQRL